MYRVIATVTVVTKNTQKVIQIPTFYVEASSADEAGKIAREVIDSNSKYELSITVSPVSVKFYV